MNNIGPEVVNPATKGHASQATTVPKDTTFHTSMAPNATTWANTWETMNKTPESNARRSSEPSERRGNKFSETFKKPKKIKDDTEGCVDALVEVMELHKEQGILKEERQACTAIFSKAI